MSDIDKFVSWFRIKNPHIRLSFNDNDYLHADLVVGKKSLSRMNMIPWWWKYFKESGPIGQAKPYTRHFYGYRKLIIMDNVVEDNEGYFLPKLYPYIIQATQPNLMNDRGTLISLYSIIHGSFFCYNYNYIQSSIISMVYASINPSALHPDKLDERAYVHHAHQMLAYNVINSESGILVERQQDANPELRWKDIWFET